MDDQALGVPDIGENAEQLDIVHQFDALGAAAPDAEYDHTARAVRQVFLREFMRRIAGKSGVAHPRDLRMMLQELRHLPRIGAVALHAQRKRFDSLQEEPCRVRRERRPLIAQPDRTQPQNERQRIQFPEIVCETQSVIAAVRFVVERELRIGPVEIPGIDDHSSDAGSVSADPLGKRVDHDVRAVLDRTQQRRRREGRVDDQRQVMLLRNRRVTFDVGDVERRVADGFDIERTGLFIDRRLCRRKIVDRREADRDSLLGQDRVELREGAAVKIVCGDQFIALPENIGDGEIDRRRAAGKRQRRCAAVELRQAFFQHVVGRIHQPGVDVARLPQREQVGAVLRAFEVVSGGAVNRHCPGAGGRFDLLAGVERQRFDMVVSIVHGCGLPVCC